MAKWKLFGKSKPEEEQIEEIKETPIEEPEENIEEIEETSDKPLAEYKETLHTGKPTKKKETPITTQSDQRLWRNVDGIEEKVDNLHKTRAQRPVTEIDKTVDKLIEKRKKK